ncbi:MAG: nuclear transport factor 2 family protein [Agriterribacter sp.]
MNSNIKALEKKYWDAMSNKDYQTVKSLTKFPCIVAGKNGVMSVDEPSFKKMFEQGNGRTIRVKSISDDQVQAGEDHAMIAYLIELDYDKQSKKCACTSTWVKDDGEWLCAMHTESDLEKK